MSRKCAPASNTKTYCGKLLKNVNHYDAGDGFPCSAWSCLDCMAAVTGLKHPDEIRGLNEMPLDILLDVAKSLNKRATKLRKKAVECETNANKFLHHANKIQNKKPRINP